MHYTHITLSNTDGLRFKIEFLLQNDVGKPGQIGSLKHCLEYCHTSLSQLHNLKPRDTRTPSPVGGHAFWDILHWNVLHEHVPCRYVVGLKLLAVIISYLSVPFCLSSILPDPMMEPNPIWPALSLLWGQKPCIMPIEEMCWNGLYQPTNRVFSSVSPPGHSGWLLWRRWVLQDPPDPGEWLACPVSATSAPAGSCGLVSPRHTRGRPECGLPGDQRRPRAQGQPLGCFKNNLLSILCSAFQCPESPMLPVSLK